MGNDVATVKRRIIRTKRLVEIMREGMHHPWDGKEEREDKPEPWDGKGEPEWQKQRAIEMTN